MVQRVEVGEEEIFSLTLVSFFLLLACDRNSFSREGLQCSPSCYASPYQSRLQHRRRVYPQVGHVYVFPPLER